MASLLAMLILAWSNRASADEPKPPPKPVVQPVGVDLNRLGIQLDLFAAEARRNRIATTLTGIGMASALIPTGIILLKRTDGVSQAVVIGMIVGGSAQLLSVLAGFIPTRMDDVRNQLQERIAAHANMHDTVETIETKWRDAAAAGRTRRIRVGGTLLTVGLMTLGTGLTFLIAPEGIFGMSREDAVHDRRHRDGNGHPRDDAGRALPLRMEHRRDGMGGLSKDEGRRSRRTRPPDHADGQCGAHARRRDGLHDAGVLSGGPAATEARTDT